MNALLLLLPAFVAGAIQIEVTPATENHIASKRYVGSERWPITITDQQTFNLRDSEAFLNSVIPGYSRSGQKKTLNFKGLMGSLKPVEVVILDTKKHTVDLGVENITNNFSSTLIVQPNTKKKVNEIMATTWPLGQDLGTSQPIYINFDNGRITLASTYGQPDYKSILNTISGNFDPVILKAGETIEVNLKAKKVHMEVKVKYEVTVEGEMCVIDSYNGQSTSSYRYYNIATYLQMLNLPHVFKVEQVISIEYYEAAKIVIIRSGSRDTTTLSPC